MKAIVVGSGTVVPRLERRQSCVVVECGDERVALDLGSGSMRGMLHAGVDPLALDRVFLTHLHPDHTSDLVPLLFSINYSDPFSPRERLLTLAGANPFAWFWNSISRTYQGWLSGAYQQALELPVPCSAPVGFSGHEISWAPATHRPESIAYRIEEIGGRSLVYTGDTEYAGTVARLARGAHTLVIECSFPDGYRVPGHLTPESVARIARESGVERVVLTHIFPQADSPDLAAEVESGFDGEVIVAYDGLELWV